MDDSKSILSKLSNLIMSILGWTWQFVRATLVTMMKVKMLIRTGTIVLAMFIWHDNNQRFERAEAYYKTVVEQGLHSTDPDVRRRAKQAMRKLGKNV